MVLDTKPHRRSSERALFFALWIVLILGLSLYRFWPGAGIELQAPPRLLLKDELLPWFKSASVTETQPSHYKLEFVLSESYRQSMKSSARDVAGHESDRRVQLSFLLLGESDNVLAQGTVPCTLQSDALKTEVELPNPKRVSARAIQLSLAH